MAEWGRKEYSKKWPSRTPVWMWLAFFLSCLFFAGMLTVEYEGSWTAAERLYLSDYMKSGARGKVTAEEHAALEARAHAAGRSLSEWVRAVLLAQPEEGASPMLLSEVLALRSLMLTLMFKVQ